MESNKRKTGTAYEAKAAEYLASQGVQILARNFRTRTGEIDLIGLDGAYLVFFEVKYRSGTGYGTALEAVNPAKQRQIMKTARQYLYQNHYRADAPVRFDCIGITGEELKWVKNAFLLR